MKDGKRRFNCRHMELDVRPARLRPDFFENLILRKPEACRVTTEAFNETLSTSFSLQYIDLRVKICS